jgi:tetratricopeptide (TPR) repeat protein
MLIHDVAYGSVPKARRARAHARVGAWIEQLNADRLDEFAELIAFHYSTAVSADDADLAWSDHPREREEIRSRAFVMLLRAGASARHRFVIDRALELHTDAARIATTDTERWRVHEELGDDHEALFRGDESVAEYLIAIENAQRLPDNDENVGNLVAQTALMTVRWGAFRETPPIERIEGLIETSLRSNVSDAVRAPLLIASAGLARGPNGSPIGTGRVLFSSLDMPDLEKRIDVIQEGLAIAQRLEDPSLQYMAYDLLAIVFQSSRQEQRYREICEQALVLLDRLPSRRQQVDMLVSVAGARADAGRYESALEAAEEAFRRSADLSPHERMHAAWEVYRSSEPLGRWDRIEELLPWYAQAAAAEGDITCAAVRAGPSLGATVVARRGGAQRAVELVPLEPLSGRSGTFGGAAMTALYVATVAGWPELRAEADHADRVIGEALDRTGSGFLATGAAPMIDALIELNRLDELATFLPIAREETRTNELVQPSADRAQAMLIAGAADVSADQRIEAESLLRSSLDRFRELGVPFEMARSAEMLAKFVDNPERERLLRLALDSYEDLRAAPHAMRIRAALASSVRT